MEIQTIEPTAIIRMVLIQFHMLAVATLLTINGAVLHRIAFKRLCAAGSGTDCAIRLLTVLGAVSAATWLYAIFVGPAKLVAPLLDLSGFMGLYFAALSIGIAVAWMFVEPRLSRRLAPETYLRQTDNTFTGKKRSKEAALPGTQPLVVNF